MRRPLTHSYWRLMTVVAVVAGLLGTAPLARAQEDDSTNDGTVTIDGGSIDVTNTFVIGGDGGEATADAGAGDPSTAIVDNAEGEASAGNGGDATASATGGAILEGEFQADPDTGEAVFVPGVIDAGGNTGNDILVADTAGGDGGDATVEIDGGDVSIISGISITANGGTAVASARGGDNNVATVTGAVTDGAAAGGTTGTTGLNLDTLVNTDLLDGLLTTLGLDAGLLDGVIGGTATTITVADLLDTLVTAGALPSDVLDALVDLGVGGTTGTDTGGVVSATIAGTASAGNGGTAVADASGGTHTVLVGDITTGGNSGNVISVGDTIGGDDGDALVRILGGDVTATSIVSISADGGLATAYADGGDDNLASVDATVIGGAATGVDPTGGLTSDTLVDPALLDQLLATLGLDAGLLDGLIGGTAVDPTVGDVLDTLVAAGADVNDVLAALLDLSVGDSPTGTATAGGNVTGTIDGTAIAGDGGLAVAYAIGGSVSVGDVDTGGNAGNDILVGDTVGWDGGDATVEIDGGNVSFLTNLGISADGGTAVADASGGDRNVATVTFDATGGTTTGGTTAGLTLDTLIPADLLDTLTTTLGLDTTILDPLLGTGTTTATVGDVLDTLIAAGVDPVDALNAVLGLGLGGSFAGTPSTLDLAFDGTAIAGMGGTAFADASGGSNSVDVGNVFTGNNSGNVITVGDTIGGTTGDASVSIFGGDVNFSTDGRVTGDGGTATALAVGGDDNVATVVSSIAGGTTGAGITTDTVIDPALLDGLLTTLGVDTGLLDGLLGGTAVAPTVGDVVDTLVAAGVDITDILDALVTLDLGTSAGTGGPGDGTAGGTALAGNAGTAAANAIGGDVEIGDIVTGNNAGNTITVGDTCGGGADNCPTADGGDTGDGGDGGDNCDSGCDSGCNSGCGSDCGCPDGTAAHSGPVASVSFTAAKGAAAVSMLPNTGSGVVQGSQNFGGALVLLGLIALAAVELDRRRRFS